MMYCYEFSNLGLKDLIDLLFDEAIEIYLGRNTNAAVGDEILRAFPFW